MKIIGITPVLNEELLIGENIDHHIQTQVLDGRVFVEGAVKTMPGTTEEGLSTDDTLNIIDCLIAGFNDDDTRKYVYRYMDERADSVADIMNALIEDIDEECWILRIDPDEFYLTEDLLKLRKFADAHPKAVALMYPFIHFYSKKKELFQIRGGCWDNLQLRFFKFRPGWKFKKHYAISDEYGNNLQTSNKYWGRRFYTDDIKIYHYNLCRPQSKLIQNAKHYLRRDGYNYSKALGKGTKYDELPEDVLDLTVREFGFFYHTAGAYLEPYDGKHPIDTAILNH